MSKATLAVLGSINVYERAADRMKVLQVATKTGQVELAFTPEQWMRLGASAGWWKEYDCGGKAIEEPMNGDEK